ncbi:citrate lyase beta subunit [Kineococcus xinjiangensis]|uniref:Citrate lyase beta subunit n=1 Tax=Kineococcus xinjiangensis TaxID=512762 RepID=A0A2S6IMB0_9ACTN|nr:HpcH/HpaI aldolase/citrate lyase family protein [Kineococcus xinjiangensis]PPK95363.1 citrate lyase beta subunit [Kineococcus xinjiangensis]
MQHFSHLPPDARERLFLRPPQPVGPDAPPVVLAHALGATLYCPATRPAMAADLARLSGRGLLSAVACLEDSVPDDRVTEAEEVLVGQLAQHRRDVEDGLARPLLLFVRVRTPDQLRCLAERLGDGLERVAGFVLPKFGAHGQPEPEEHLAAVAEVARAAGRRMWAMPVVETADVLHRETRLEALLRVRDVLAAHRERVLAVRTGATDLSAVHGLRRPRGTTVWDVRVVADALGDVINVLGRLDGTGFPVTGPVWEHFTSGERLFRTELRQTPFEENDVRELRTRLLRDDLDGLLREVELDRVNGLVGKTVIHPSHVPVVHAMSVVPHEEWCDARDVLGAGSGGVMASAYGNKMNEAKPHRAWAERVLARADAFGVAREGISVVDVVAAQVDAVEGVRVELPVVAQRSVEVPA